MRVKSEKIRFRIWLSRKVLNFGLWLRPTLTYEESMDEYVYLLSISGDLQKIIDKTIVNPDVHRAVPKADDSLMTALVEKKEKEKEIPCD